MARKSRFLLNSIYEVKLLFSKVVLWLSIKLGLIHSIIIVPFNGYGNATQIFLVGRVLKNNRVGLSTIEDSVWSNVKRMIRRFSTVVLPGATVKAQFQGKDYLVQTNEEGYFELTIELTERLEVMTGWIEVKLILMDQILRNQPPVEANAAVFIPESSSDFGIISDIDDTIVPTGAMRLTEMIKTTFSKNAHSRLPFPGVAELYRSLEQGSSGLASNPFFYVSSSPWNLYDFLWELLHVHDIPAGPLMLRDIGLSRTELIAGDHEQHKTEQISKILTSYPSMPFILIGDSGQDDPMIYLKIIKAFPNRILGVFIRDIHDSRHEFVMEKKAEMHRLGVEMRMGKDTDEAKSYAITQGWIKPW